MTRSSATTATTGPSAAPIRDHLYGGLGDDLLNADDNLDTTNGTNDAADTGALPTPDVAFGGGGRDVLIGNSKDDRLIDWVGEFNSYIVPFSPFGLNTVSRVLSPDLPGYLLKLAASDGLDLTRTEPTGELGIVLQKDAAGRRRPAR